MFMLPAGTGRRRASAEEAVSPPRAKGTVAACGRQTPKGIQYAQPALRTTVDVSMTQSQNGHGGGDLLGTRTPALPRTELDASLRLASIVASSDDAIISKTLDGVITSWNLGAEQIFGYTADEAIGQSITILFPPEHIDEELEIVARIRRGERVTHYETKRCHKDGTVLDISLSVSPLVNERGEIVGASKIARDITQRKRNEEALALASMELARSRDELELRIQERTASLREAVARMEEFSFMVSHDLRAPLRAMNFYSHSLLEDHRDLFAGTPEALAGVQRIADNAKRLDQMVRDVLAFSQVTVGAIVLEPISLDAVVQSIIDHHPQLQPPQAELVVGRLGAVVGHETSLTQALANLLLNAVKYVQPGVTPRVEVWTEPREDQSGCGSKITGLGSTPRITIVSLIYSSDSTRTSATRGPASAWPS